MYLRIAWTDADELRISRWGMMRMGRTVVEGTRTRYSDSWELYERRENNLKINFLSWLQHIWIFWVQARTLSLKIRIWLAHVSELKVMWDTNRATLKCHAVTEITNSQILDSEPPRVLPYNPDSNFKFRIGWVCCHSYRMVSRGTTILC